MPTIENFELAIVIAGLRSGYEILISKQSALGLLAFLEGYDMSRLAGRRVIIDNELLGRFNAWMKATHGISNRLMKNAVR